MIAIASYIYLSVGGIVGAIMFSIGLLTILNMQFKLFTGSVGYIKSKNDIKHSHKWNQFFCYLTDSFDSTQEHKCYK